MILVELAQAPLGLIVSECPTRFIRKGMEKLAKKETSIKCQPSNNQLTKNLKITHLNLNNWGYLPQKFAISLTFLSGNLVEHFLSCKLNN